ncbi:hypothetical protein wCauBTS_13370 [Wolbachia pipientis]|jgi:Transposase and inactivated derivatives|uniref:Transposase n=1 Tax=Wolbachia endosymbiont of Cadra cautella TaxID=190193 RepID=B9A8R3_9RICK|nr:transposase [Wolbachia endosymbiont of Cadra cautella]
MWNIIEKAVTLYIYHIVWITKYRYPVLVGDIGQKAKEVVQEVCANNQVEIIRGRVASSHVHVYVSVPPYLSISKLVQLIKGKSSRKIQQNFPELKKRYWVVGSRLVCQD